MHLFGRNFLCWIRECCLPSRPVRIFSLSAYPLTYVALLAPACQPLTSNLPAPLPTHSVTESAVRLMGTASPPPATRTTSLPSRVPTATWTRTTRPPPPNPPKSESIAFLCSCSSYLALFPSHPQLPLSLAHLLITQVHLSASHCTTCSPPILPPLMQLPRSRPQGWKRDHHLQRHLRHPCLLRVSLDAGSAAGWPCEPTAAASVLSHLEKAHTLPLPLPCILTGATTPRSLTAARGRTAWAASSASTPPIL